MDRLDVLDKKLRELERKQDFGKYPEYVTNSVNKAREEIMQEMSRKENVMNRKIMKLSSDIKLLDSAIRAASNKGDNALNSIKKLKTLVGDNSDASNKRLDLFERVVNANKEHVSEMIAINKKMRSNLIDFFKDLPDKMSV